MFILPKPRRARHRIVAAWATCVLVLTGSFALIQAPLFGGELAAPAFASTDAGTITAADEPAPVPNILPTNPPPENPQQGDPPPQDPPQQPPPPTYPPLPAGSGEGRRVVYSNSGQRLWLVEEDGNVTNSWLVSGRKGLPRAGTYKVASKSRYSSARGGGLRLQFMVRFAKPRRLWIGFHSIPVTRRGQPIQTESQLGTYRSAGCVRQRLADAEILYNWAPLGTKVVVTS
jgi:lipoprotein-anchoring transpeptidase ErfK/SrfK